MRPGFAARSASAWSILPAVLLCATASSFASDAPAKDAPDPTTHQLIHDGVVAMRESNFPRAGQFFAQAAAIDPALTRAHFGVALAALGRGDRKEFEKALRRVDSLTHGAPEVRYILAVQKWMTGDLRAAEEELRDVARLDPSFLEARYTLGVVLAAKGDLKGAASLLHEAILIDSSYASGRLELAAVLAAAGDLDGSVQELRNALLLDPTLGSDKPEHRIRFEDRRVLLGTSHGESLGLPLPLPRPAFLPPERERASADTLAVRPVPEWYLDYVMALCLEDQERWSGAVTLLERALSLNAREELQTPVADRLVDYLPHRHLAKASYGAGNLREAQLHLEAARNQGVEPAEDLRLLETLVKIASGRVSIVLQPVPDHTTDDTVMIRGVLLARDTPSWIEVGGQKALLRDATAEEARSLLAGAAPAPDSGIKTLYFEVPLYRLAAEGPNVIKIRPGGTTASAAEMEVLIVKDTTPRKGAAAAKSGGGEP